MGYVKYTRYISYIINKYTIINMLIVITKWKKSIKKINKLFDTFSSIENYLRIKSIIKYIKYGMSIYKKRLKKYNQYDIICYVYIKLNRYSSINW